jgi:hypothetical protein
MITLSGVRSSWLIVPMKSDFTLLARLVSTRAVSSARQARRRSMPPATTVAYSLIKVPFPAAPAVPLKMIRPQYLNQLPSDTKCQTITWG